MNYAKPMDRFIVIKNKEFALDMITTFLNPKGYVRINGRTGGDDDFICVDTSSKEWCWCENGFYPFCSSHYLDEFQDKDVSLNDLVKLRY